MRMQVRAPVTREELEERIRPVADRFAMQWHLDVVGRRMKVLLDCFVALHNIVVCTVTGTTTAAA